MAQPIPAPTISNIYNFARSFLYCLNIFAIAIPEKKYDEDKIMIAINTFAISNGLLKNSENSKSIRKTKGGPIKLEKADNNKNIEICAFEIFLNKRFDNAPSPKPATARDKIRNAKV
jgi:hypothetical protein